jgi:hypothetical protein
MDLQGKGKVYVPLLSLVLLVEYLPVVLVRFAIGSFTVL